MHRCMATWLASGPIRPGIRTRYAQRYFPGRQSGRRVPSDNRRRHFDGAAVGLDAGPGLGDIRAMGHCRPCRSRRAIFARLAPPVCAPHQTSSDPSAAGCLACHSQRDAFGRAGNAGEFVDGSSTQWKGKTCCPICTCRIGRGRGSTPKAPARMRRLCRHPPCPPQDFAPFDSRTEGKQTDRYLPDLSASRDRSPRPTRVSAVLMMFIAQVASREARRHRVSCL